MDVARAGASGRYASNVLLRGNGPINLRMNESDREVNELNNYLKQPRLTILSNRDLSDDPIALYDTRSNENLYMEQTTGSTKMRQELTLNNREKVINPTDDRVPRTDVPFFDLHGDGMKRIPNGSANSDKPTLVDDRILQHTNDREFAYESEQINAARNLQNSAKRWDLIERQFESDRKLLGEPAAANRYNEPALAYAVRGTHMPEFEYREMVKSRVDEAAAVANGDLSYATAQEREFKAAMQPHADANINLRRDIVVPDRVMNQYDWNGSDREHYQEPYRRRASVFDNLVDKFSNWYRRVFKSDNSQERRLIDEIPNAEFYDDGQTPFSVERGEIKPMIFVNRETAETIPEIEGTDLTASTFINDFGERSMMLETYGNELILLQKVSPEKTFTGDGQRMEDDYIAVAIPEYIKEKLRGKIRNSEGRHFKELTLGDYEELIDFVNKNPGEQQRVSANDVYLVVKDSAEDARMLREFAGKYMIMPETMREDRYEDRIRFSDVKERAEGEQRTHENLLDGRPDVSLRQTLKSDVNDRQFTNLDRNELRMPGNDELSTMSRTDAQPIDSVMAPRFQFASKGRR